jgi:hypothetical protein
MVFEYVGVSSLVHAYSFIQAYDESYALYRGAVRGLERRLGLDHHTVPLLGRESPVGRDALNGCD